MCHRRNPSQMYRDAQKDPKRWKSESSLFWCLFLPLLGPYMLYFSPFFLWSLSGVFGPRPSSKVDRSVELQCTLVKGVRPKPKNGGQLGVSVCVK